MKSKAWYIIIAGLFLLAGCEKREKGEPPRTDWIHLGTPACHGDVCYTGQ